jgi:hypothetical protein
MAPKSHFEMMHFLDRHSKLKLINVPQMGQSVCFNLHLSPAQIALFSDYNAQILILLYLTLLPKIHLLQHCYVDFFTYPVF